MDEALYDKVIKMEEYRFLKEDRSTFIGELSLSLVKDKNSKPTLFIGFIRDITNQKISENELRKNKQMFQLVIDNIPQLISWKDTKSIYMGCNKNFARVAGLNSPGEIIGKSDYELPWKISEAESFFEIDQLVMDTDKPEYHIIEPQLQADGKQAWLDTNKVPLHDDDDNVVGLLCTYEDITERIEAEKALKKSEKKYREAYNRAEFYKDVFAHDVSNMLQGILSSIELCRMSLNTERKVEDFENLFEIIEDQVKRGANLVSNIRKISLIDDIKKTLVCIEACKFINNAIVAVKNAFPKRTINIRFDSKYTEVNVKANDLLQDVFNNVLFNAVKHNKSSKVEIQVRIKKIIKDDINYFKFEFQDNGIGVSDSQKTVIFQMSNVDYNSFNRLGLGLSLVKKLIESYKGEIWVENKVQGDYSQGSNFVLLIEEWK